MALIDTINKNYSFKWALDKKGNWKLFIRRLNGRLLNLSNVWINLEKTVYNSNGEKNTIIDYYYFDINENMVTGWYIDVNNAIYFLDTDPKELGKMARGWRKINGDYYYFNDSGVLLKDTITPDGFHVDAYGRWK
jgi:glucan-binding YG repeat protein